MSSKTFKVRLVKDGSMCYIPLKAKTAVWHRWQMLSYSHQREKRASEESRAQFER
jgi:hypothetical protein